MIKNKARCEKFLLVEYLEKIWLTERLRRNHCEEMIRMYEKTHKNQVRNRKSWLLVAIQEDQEYCQNGYLPETKKTQKEIHKSKEIIG